MGNQTNTGNYLRVSLDLMVEVTDTEALQNAALADLRARDLDAEEREAQQDQIIADATGATALRWLISPDDILGLVDRILEIDPVEAVLEISESEGVLSPEQS
ncbi:hypothetical protein ABGB12_26710 [Actinocorallia sp. B10E7]|uniref:hypothetical protein n=1 Tax=Actinocorallia sp. B10E7 TaxID=3153558 RepID=UPI00325CF3F1